MLTKIYPFNVIATAGTTLTSSKTYISLHQNAFWHRKLLFGKKTISDIKELAKLKESSLLALGIGRQTKHN